MKSISLHRQASALLVLALASMSAFADEPRIERRVVPAQLVNGQFIMQGSEQPTYPGLPVGAQVMDRPASAPIAPSPAQTDGYRAPPEIPRASGAATGPVVDAGARPADTNASGNVGEAWVRMAGGGDLDELLARAAHQHSTAAPAGQAFALPDAPASMDVRALPRPVPQLALAATSKEGILPALTPSNVLSTQAVAIPSNRRALARAATAPVGEHGSQPLATARAGGRATPAARTPTRVAATASTAVRNDPAAVRSSTAFEFALKEGDRLSIAMREFLKGQQQRMQWNTRTDFVIEHPYKVARATLAQTLTDVLREYRLSATIWQGNGVVEIFMQNGEINNESTQ